jgi:quercetin dioxygenase-like cupin family protein
VGVGLALGPAAADTSATTAAGSNAGAITRSELGEAQPINAPGQSLYLQRVTIPPGEKLVEHFHQGTQVARVIEGVLTYDVISGTARVTRRDGSTESVTGPRTIRLKPGESLVEVQSLAHAGSNAGKRPVVIELAALLATGAPLATPVGTNATGTALKLTGDLVSQETRLTTVGPDSTSTYGWNRLTGTATDTSGPVAIEMLGNVAYTNGSGPFSGTITFTFSDGSMLGVQMQGAATKAPDTGATTFAATLGVLNGTGKYLNATGTGTFTGSRSAALGQAVDAAFDFTVQPAK